jgi:hypothetical protein
MFPEVLKSPTAVTIAVKPAAKFTAIKTLLRANMIGMETTAIVMY